MKKKNNYRKKRKNKKNYLGSFLMMAAGSIVFFFLVSGFFIIRQVVSIERNEIQQTDSEQVRKNFIETIAPISQRVSKEYGVLPSIIIGQAILESNFGQSQLAAQYNNLFGIKAAKHEQRVLLPTKEFEDDTWLDQEAYFKVYPSYEEAIVDHSQLFVAGVSWDQQLYQGVLTARNYKEAANALQNAGYATDPDYASKIIQVIENYGLAAFDS